MTDLKPFELAPATILEALPGHDKTGGCVVWLIVGEANGQLGYISISLDELQTRATWIHPEKLKDMKVLELEPMGEGGRL